MSGLSLMCSEGHHPRAPEWSPTCLEGRRPRGMFVPRPISPILNPDAKAINDP